MATLPRPAEPSRSPSLEVLESSPFHVKPKRLLDVSDVAEWLGVSKGWVRDHALGRRNRGCSRLNLVRRRERACGSFAKKLSISLFRISGGDRDRKGWPVENSQRERESSWNSTSLLGQLTLRLRCGLIAVGSSINPGQN